MDLDLNQYRKNAPLQASLSSAKSKPLIVITSISLGQRPQLQCSPLRPPSPQSNLCRGTVSLPRSFRALLISALSGWHVYSAQNCWFCQAVWEHLGWGGERNMTLSGLFLSCFGNRPLPLSSWRRLCLSRVHFFVVIYIMQESLWTSWVGEFVVSALRTQGGERSERILEWQWSFGWEEGLGFPTKDLWSLKDSWGADSPPSRCLPSITSHVTFTFDRTPIHQKKSSLSDSPSLTTRFFFLF